MSESTASPSKSQDSNQPIRASKACRRDFIRTSATSMGAVAVVTAAGTQEVRAPTPNEKIRIGFIGTGGRGFGAHVKR